MSGGGGSNLTHRQLRAVVEHQNQPRVACYRTWKFRFSSCTTLSLLASLTFFFMSGYLIWTTAERTVVLFLMAAFFFVETIFFTAYCVDVLLMKRDKLKWHSSRIWFPMTDLVAVLMATFVESLLLPCGTLIGLWNQFSSLEELYYWLLIQTAVTLSVKTITAIALTTMHSRGLARLSNATHRLIDLDNYPHTREVALQEMPELDTDYDDTLGVVSASSMRDVEDASDEDSLAIMQRLQTVFRTPPPTAPHDDA